MPGSVYKIAQGENAQKNAGKKYVSSKELAKDLSPVKIVKIKGNEKQGKKK